MKTKKVILFIIIFIITIIGLHFYKCPLKYIFGLECPLCGTTRAFLSVLHFKFNKAFYYHALWPLTIIFILFHVLIEFKIIRISKRIINIILYLFSIIYIVYYLYRLFNGSGVVNFNFQDSLIYKLINNLIK